MIDATMLQDAMGHIDERFLAEVMEACPLTAVRTPRRTWVRRIATAAACLCVAVGLGVGGMQALYFMGQRNHKSEDAVDIDISNTITADVVWLEPNEAESGSISSADENSIHAEASASATAKRFGGWVVSGQLCAAWQDAPDSRIAVLFSPVCHGNERFEAFVHEGRTRTEWEAYREMCFAEQEKRLMLLKEGDALKHGEALYTTGTPEGERWAKSLYDERVAYYGQAFLSRYIVDGELLRDTLEREAAEYLAEYERVAYVLSDLVAAYRAEMTHEAAATLSTQGVLCELRHGQLFVFLNLQQLKRIDGVDKDAFTLTAASRRLYEAGEDLFAYLDISVTGFDTDKLTIATDYIRPATMRDDAEVIAAIRYLYDYHQYTHEYLEVSISAGATVTDEDVVGLGGEVTYRSQYIDLIYAHIPFDRLDLQALRDLTLRADVGYIHIGMPMTCVPAEDTAG